LLIYNLLLICIFTSCWLSICRFVCLSIC